ncbi:MAG: hypothetical protein FWD19_06145, partial [Defluviitaleaceae bacterium]|nr:hypothetical protein [Defluviitaleaceae bacterium]
MKKRALISVSDKTGIFEFAKGLVDCGYEIVSTGGTYELLKPLGALNISEVTRFPEILDGRVKTLHPSIHGGILAVRENAAHMATLSQHEINTIDIVAVNLYPFKETLARGASEAETIENIDIGGPSMIRSAAKNHANVAVVVDPADYEKILCELNENKNSNETENFEKNFSKNISNEEKNSEKNFAKNISCEEKNSEKFFANEISSETKKLLAAKAFRHTAAY